MAGDPDGRLPWMPWYVDDHARVVMGWPPLARLAYRELLDHQWATGALPADLELLRRLVPGVPAPQWRRVWPVLECLFPLDEDGSRRNTDLEVLRTRQRSVHASRSRSARDAARARWGARDA